MHPEAPDDGGVDRLLRALDHPLPAVTADDLLRRGRARRAPWLRVAAAVAALLALAGGAWALPGSPFPEWVRTGAARLGWGREAPPAPAQAVDAPADAGAGVAFDPSRPLLVVFRPRVPGVVVRVSFTEEGEIVAFAPPGGARFTSEPARLVVDALAAGTFEVRVPRDAVRVEIVSGVRRIFLKEGPEVSADAPASGGGFLLPLGEPAG